jgi:5-methylcytosine-specific restriction endonuclease McrA
MRHDELDGLLIIPVKDLVAAWVITDLVRILSWCDGARWRPTSTPARGVPFDEGWFDGLADTVRSGRAYAAQP